MSNVRPFAFFLFLFLVAAGALGGCSSQPSATAAASPGASMPADAATPGTAAAPMGDATQSAVQVVSGKVVETMNAASYTYVLVDTGSDKVWAASGQFEVAVGDRVVIPLETRMDNFHSESLKRDFPVIYFSSRVTREGEQVRPAMMAGHPPIGGRPAAAAAAAVTEPIDPPQGGTSVADVWTKRASLAGTAVTVRGKVVKFSGGIMGRNWLHIQDGSGKAEDGTHDLTVTTADTAAVGDVVTVTGTVAVDKDFTAGYAYPVMLEQAKVAPK